MSDRIRGKKVNCARYALATVIRRSHTFTRARTHSQLATGDRSNLVTFEPFISYSSEKMFPAIVSKRNQGAREMTKTSIQNGSGKRQRNETKIMYEELG